MLTSAAQFLWQAYEAANERSREDYLRRTRQLRPPPMEQRSIKRQQIEAPAEQK